MKYLLEVFLKQGTPLIAEACDDYFVSHDGMRLHLKSARKHKIVPMDNVLMIAAYDQETTNK